MNMLSTATIFVGVFLLLVRKGDGETDINGFSSKLKSMLKNVPWAKPATSSAKPPCLKTQCDFLSELCYNNGGTCEIVDDCSVRCKCAKGYTGFFCGVKVTPDATTLSVDITTAIQRTLSTAYHTVRQLSTHKSNSIVPGVAVSGKESTTRPTARSSTTPTRRSSTTPTRRSSTTPIRRSPTTTTDSSPTTTTERSPTTPTERSPTKPTDSSSTAPTERSSTAPTERSSNIHSTEPRKVSLLKILSSKSLTPT